MTRKERYERILAYFRQTMPEVTTELSFGSDFQLLVATVLSAQCTDKRVNEVTPALFKRYPDARTMSQATEEELLLLMGSVSYPNAKARHLIQLSRQLWQLYGGRVPEGMDQLTALPGVGRKTANVIRAVWFGHEAIAVDTHVYRVSHRLGLVSAKADTPLKVERELIRQLPRHEAAKAHHWLLLHGRYICKSQKPQCHTCPFDSFCPKLIEGSKLS